MMAPKMTNNHWWNYLKSNYFQLILVATFLVAIWLRIYNYTNRINFETDNTRDAIIGQYAGDNFKLPLIGQFTSAGPFFYGPWWYWFLACISKIPLGYLTYWYVMTGVSLVFIALIGKLAKEITGDNTLAVIVMILAAVSHAQVGNSLSIFNPSIIPFLSLVCFYCLMAWFKKGRLIYLFGLGFVWGLAMTIHFQTILTWPILLTAVISRRPKWRYWPIYILGILIPFVPLIIFDAQHHWFNFGNIYKYLTVDQYKIWVPNRWLIYAGQYWPKTWGYIIGGSNYIGWLLIILLAILTLINLKNFLKQKNYYLLAITFVAQVVLYRYYRGERYVYYSFFAHPSVILLSAWVIYKLYHWQKIIGLGLLTFVFIGSLIGVINSFYPGIMTYNHVLAAKQDIYAKYSTQKFSIYGCKDTGYINGYALSYLIYRDQRQDENGVKIGVCFIDKNPVAWQVLTESQVNQPKPDWYNKNVNYVYEDTVDWWIKKPPS